MSLPSKTHLTGMTTREAIVDAFYRIMSGFDENDVELLQSGMTEDINLNFNGKNVQGYENVKKVSFDVVGAMDTTHFITSPRIDYLDATALCADMTVNTLAQHYPPGMGVTDSTMRLLGGSKHKLSLIKDEAEDLWKVQQWTMKTVWSEGDHSILSPKDS